MLALTDLAEVTGTAFTDENSNGALDPGEVGTSGVVVNLYADSNTNGVFDTVGDSLIGSQTTDASGSYGFDDVVAGNYFVQQPAQSVSGNDLSEKVSSLIAVSSTDAMGLSGVSVDTFSTTAAPLTAAFPVGTSADTFITAAEAIGGERDLMVVLTAGGALDSVTMNSGAGMLSLNPTFSATGIYTVSWDGPDNDGASLDVTGLNGTAFDGDLTARGATSGLSTGFHLTIGVDQPGGTARVRVFTDGSNWSETAIPLSPLANPDVFVPFSGVKDGLQFVTGTGANGPADFTNVGSIQLEVEATQTAMDSEISLIGAVGPTVFTANFANMASMPGVDIEKSTNGQDADVAPGPGIAVGSTVAFAYVVNNTGNVALGNVTVTDNQGIVPVFQSGDTDNDDLLDVDETWIYQATTTAVAFQYANIGTVVANPVDDNGADIPGLADVSDNDASHYFGFVSGVGIEKSTNGQDADTPPGPGVAVGSTVTFEYVVTNGGNTPLGNISVTDSQGVVPVLQGGDDDNDGLLDVGETWTYQATAAAVAGQQSNTGSVVGNPVTDAGVDIPGAADVTDSDPSHYFGLLSSVRIEKSTNGQDADIPTGPVVPVGDTVTFTYVVTNPGNNPLGSVAVTDDQGVVPAFQGGDTDNDGLLDTDETWTYQASSTALAGQNMNTASVTANPVDDSGNDIPGLSDVTDTDMSHHFGAIGGVLIEKSTNGVDADAPPGPDVAVGTPVNFVYVVTNTGNVPLGNVAVTDDQAVVPAFQGGDVDNDGLLDPGETWTYQATIAAAIGQYSNLGTVTANPVDPGGADIPGLQDVANSDASHYFGRAAVLDIQKSTNGQDADVAPGPGVAVGSTVLFSYVVTNTGNVALGDVTVTDNQGVVPVFQSGDVDNDGVLDVNETWTYQATATAVASQYSNLGTVVANPVDDAGADIPGLADVTDNDPSNYFGIVPGVRIEKSTNGQDADAPPGPNVAVGSTVTFEYVVTNDGNTPLGNITVTDSQGIVPVFQGGDADNDGLLDLNETWTYQATATAAVGQQSNTGSVVGNPVDDAGVDIPGVSDATDSDISYHIGVVAGIHVEKLTNGQDADSPRGPGVAVGDMVTFTYDVTNTGDTLLGDVSVTDDQGVVPVFQGGDLDNDGLLDLNETWTYRATSVAVAGQQANMGSVVGNPVDDAGVDIPGLPDATDSDMSHHFGLITGLQIQKSTNGQDADAPTGPFVPVGATVNFTYVVTNSGNTALGSVAVTDDQGVVPVFQGGDTDGDGLLDTNETWTYQAAGTAAAGQNMNIGRVTGNPVDDNGTDIPGFPDATASDPSHHFGSAPGIGVQKFTNGDPANNPNDPDVPQLLEGTTVTFTYEVSNTGNVPLSDVTVRDDNGTPTDAVDDFFASFTGGDSNTNNLLDTNELWTFGANRTVTPGLHQNTGTASGTGPTGQTVNSTDTSNHVGIALTPVISKRHFLAST